MGQTCLIEIEKEELELLPLRAIHWSSQRTVIVADLHWGKGETFRKSGIPVPDALAVEEMDRLGAVIETTGASRVVVLGDLVHSPLGLTPQLTARVREWRKRFPVEMIVTVGNHDRSWKKFPGEWEIDWVKEWNLRNFVFRHDLEGARGGAFAFTGHLHPTYRISRGPDSLRLPCFHFEPSYAVLPSFNYFTRGVEMVRGKTSRTFVVTERKVVELL